MRTFPRLLAVAALAGLITNTPASAQQPARISSSAGPLSVETVASGLENPWGLAFLPDGRMLVTERPGRLRIVSRSGTVSAPVAGLPPVYATGQGGLLDVALAPDFASSGKIFLSYAEPREGASGTSVARARLVEDGGDARLDGLTVIFRQSPAAGGSNHYGSRLVFARDGTLFVTLGDRYSLREQAQDLSVHIGKIVRINTDGSVPEDNPFRSRAGARPEIWSYGHRNVQGAALDPATGRLWTIEHGARGGDELNHPEAGKNYGWPVITYGRDYSGARIGEGTERAGMEQPVKYWDPSFAPSGLAFYTGDLMPRWKGDLFTGGLAGTRLVHLKLDPARERVIEEEVLLTDLGERIRDVRQGPDGALWLLTDDPGEGRLLRLSPDD
ncbi:glucose sorbosone dehydrogenase [Ancylobacter novellus DSM 506]|uniref:Glucose sorbosone dehydrogenase n=1 Tax=Ancylobacter novellus (strain ATCC 8093 / DSM 506 / JCM 20403 / CCM 1077 / IAM 12100 / NBRC 12443 / NCIMB 10456) TaxID=639283 RepID=D7A3A6_ANCN5|nr:glucose sorbosone dehydrogenase [Ancylobacter novellus DSM 506]